MAVDAPGSARTLGTALRADRAPVLAVPGLESRAGVDWRVIESATGLDRGGFDALKEKLASDRLG